MGGGHAKRRMCREGERLDETSLLTTDVHQDVKMKQGMNSLAVLGLTSFLSVITFHTTRAAPAVGPAYICSISQAGIGRKGWVCGGWTFNGGYVSRGGSQLAGAGAS